MELIARENIYYENSDIAMFKYKSKRQNLFISQLCKYNLKIGA